MIRVGVAIFGAILLSGCMQSIKEIGSNPALSNVGDGLIGEYVPDSPQVYKTSSAKPMFSVWDDQRGDLFSDKLALEVGHILNIQVSINDQARLTNQSDSKQTVGRGVDIAGNYKVGEIGNNGSANANLDSSTAFNGNGKTTRSETINLSVAAVVTDVLGNGNLIIRGSQEVRVNAELRVLTIAGIVSPKDIGINNSVSYERVAEARVSYGGRGHISRVQRPPYGQQILRRILPF